MMTNSDEERRLTTLAREMINFIILDSGDPRIPGDFIKRYGKYFEVDKLKAHHFNHPIPRWQQKLWSGRMSSLFYKKLDK